MNIEQALALHREAAEQLYDQAAVDQAVAALAERTEARYRERFPVLLCVMNGGLYMTAQLMRHWHFPMTVDYVHATRYRLATLGRDVLWKAYPQTPLKDRFVIIVDDIYDQGYTLREVRNWCLKQGASGCESLFLIRKQHDRPRADIEADHAALECGDRYVYGSGIDLHGHFRNLPGIFAIPPNRSGR